MPHVLIIEDEPMIAMSIELTLEDAGATSFDTVDSEQAAIDAARRHRPDIITSDVKLLLGTGPQAVRTIRSELGNIPVIFLTGTPQECEPCNPPGQVLTKPFNADLLMSAFKEALN